MFAYARPMSTYEVEVKVPQPLTEDIRRFLTAAQSSANRILGFRAVDGSIRLTVEAGGATRNEAIRQAAREVAKVFPAGRPEFVEVHRRSPGPTPG
jgi:hypothetical protein